MDTALILLALTEDLNGDGEGEPIAVHMGVNSGTALVGSSRFESARGARWTFTATGPVTNVAARLVDRAAAGQIVIGPETALRLGDAYRLESLGAENFKNVSDAVEIHRVLGAAT